MRRKTKTNVLYYGDNLEILREYVGEESVDLCYIDPPFNSKRNYNQIYTNVGKEDRAQAQAFIDTWAWDTRAEEGFAEIVSNTNKRFTKQSIHLIIGLQKVLGKGGLFAYLISMTLRIAEIYRVLKTTGSFYLHCDSTASHYLKLILDSIFVSRGGEYQNEIIWYYRRWTGSAKSFLRMHDNIFFYTKRRNEHIFNAPRTQYTGESYFRKQSYHTRIKGDDVYVTKIDKKGVKDNDVWVIDDLDDTNRILDFMKTEEILNSTLLKYLAFINKEFESYGLTSKEYKVLESVIKKLQIKFGDVFPISIINSQAKERLGYPTQKPESLLEKIIKVGSNEGDVILDAYCGCGTTIAVAEQLKRRWIGIDITYQSISLILKRLEEHFSASVIHNIELNGIPKDFESAVALAHKEDDRTRKEFEKWAILTFSNNRAIINEKKGGDRGIDGISFVTDINENNEQIIKEVLFSVKSDQTLNPSVIRELNGTIERERAVKGYLITLYPMKNLVRESKKYGLYENKSFGKTYSKIEVINIQEMLDGKRMDLPIAFDVLKTATAKNILDQLSLELK